MSFYLYLTIQETSTTEETNALFKNSDESLNKVPKYPAFMSSGFGPIFPYGGIVSLVMYPKNDCNLSLCLHKGTGAGDRNRTCVLRLETFCITILLHPHYFGDSGGN